MHPKIFIYQFFFSLKWWRHKLATSGIKLRYFLLAFIGASLSQML